MEQALTDIDIGEGNKGDKEMMETFGAERQEYSGLLNEWKWPW